MQENWVQSLGQKDPLEEEMATYSSILAWEIPWTEKPGGLQSTRSQTVGHNWATEHTHTVTGCAENSHLSPPPKMESDLKHNLGSLTQREEELKYQGK